MAHPRITRFASNFIILQSLIRSKVDSRYVFSGEEQISSSYGTTTARIDVENCIFDEQAFGHVV